ncbi:retinol dehydrogenase 8 isoform X2 [Rhineura floridana]|uniref:retinol dehydrogenase 8 isoform X2 n=1 Tax=Rhineura floridana TaxID=261503 RepID=UPI002AC81E58|nr:retinol dehydrogenase 8 isoform X2 [Rhineura floridana]
MLIPSGTSHCSSAMAKAAPRTVLITGCSSGIGLHMAVQLAQDPRKRFHVIATMRDLRKKDKLEAAAGDTLNKTLSIQHLDVCSDELVTECINSLPEKRLDVLVNNAGVGLVGPVESISIDDMKRIFETNFFGAIRMIKAVLPERKQYHKGHIVVISSVMGLHGMNRMGGQCWRKQSTDIQTDASVNPWLSSVTPVANRDLVGPGISTSAADHSNLSAGVPFNDVYAASKFAMEGFCESLAVQLLKFNIFISLVEPGPVNTEFETKLMEEVTQSEFPGADAATVHYFKEIYLSASHEIFTTMGQTPESVAKVPPPYSK